MRQLSIPAIALLLALTNIGTPPLAGAKDAGGADPSKAAPNSVTPEDKQRIKQILDQLRSSEDASGTAGLMKFGGMKSIIYRQAQAMAVYAKVTKSVQQQLTMMGPKIAPELVVYLGGSDRDVTDVCGRTLGSFGVKVLPLVVSAIKEGKVQSSNPWSSVIVFQQVGIDAVPTVLELIKNGNENQTLIGLYSLQSIFPEGAAGSTFSKLQPDLKASALKSVHKAMSNKSSQVRLLAVSVLGGIAPGEPDTTRAVTAALSDKDATVRQTALGVASHALKKEEALPLILKAFGDKDLAVRQTATVMLTNIPELDRETIDQLSKSARSDSNAEFRASCLTALGVCSVSQKSLHNDSVARLVASALESDKSARVRVAAAGVLGGCNKYGTDIAIAALRKCIKDPDSTVSDASLMALGRLGPAAASVLPDLVQGMNSSDSRRKLQTVRTIASMRTAAVPALPDLVKMAASPHIDPTMRLALADAFQNMGDKASSAVPALMQMLKDKNIIVQQKAVVALGAIGPAAKEAEKPLQDLAGSSARLRVSIFMALSRINPKGSTAATPGSIR